MIVVGALYGAASHSKGLFFMSGGVFPEHWEKTLVSLPVECVDGYDPVSEQAVEDSRGVLRGLLEAGVVSAQSFVSIYPSLLGGVHMEWNNNKGLWSVQCVNDRSVIVSYCSQDGSQLERIFLGDDAVMDAVGAIVEYRYL